MNNEKTTEEFDLVGHIIAHEGGELDDTGTLKLFSHLVRSGQAWSLQGHYGRAAEALIDNGYIEANTGRILKEVT